MKKQVIQILAIASLLSATVVAQAPPPSPGDISVFIPFEFRTGARVLPRGGYTIYKAASGLRLCGDESIVRHAGQPQWWRRRRPRVRATSASSFHSSFEPVPESFPEAATPSTRRLPA